MKLTDVIDTLPRTSPVTIKKLKSLGINTYQELLEYFPNRYENFSTYSLIKDLQEGETVTVIGKILECKNVFTRKGITIQKALIEDSTGKLELTWYNQPYLTRLFRVGEYLSAAGLVKRFMQTFSLDAQEYEVLKNPNDVTIHTKRFVPIYPEKNGVSSKTIREKIFRALQAFEKDVEESEFEWLPSEILSYNKLISEKEAFKNIHFPIDIPLANLARQRLSFDELFTIQLSAAIIREEWKKEAVTNPLIIDDKINANLQKFIEKLPFALTNAQQKVLEEILTDLRKTSPMNRFLQGDVGSGKTVVAAIACYLTHLNGYQSLIMAPTEILAQQHYKTISSLLESYDIRVGLHTGSKKISKKFSTDDFNVFVGTHALISEKLKFGKVGFIVIDEQHRFGVGQRSLLKKKGVNPHLLTMTATPIPRTVALTLYGELDLSVIDEMPYGRQPIKTYVAAKHKRESAYQWIIKQIKEHQSQAYVICPLIEESEHETMNSVRAAKKEYEFLKEKVFKELNVGLLHGKMKSSEKEGFMTEFKNKKYDVLVSTSVVEVGIDVPNATIMLIEGAERYGLAQLHQLRGRVGRGSMQSYCLLFTSDSQPETSSRLKYFADNISGLAIAEYDFRLRGPGEVFGMRQHGYADLKLADLTNVKLLESVKNAVKYFTNSCNLDKFVKVKERVEELRVHQISRD